MEFYGALLRKSDKKNFAAIKLTKHLLKVSKSGGKRMKVG